MSGSSRSEDSILRPPLVGFQGIVVYATEAGLVALAVVLPALAHALGINGAAVLPMHWTVILAAVVLGWKAGAIAGFAAPALNTFFTGLPMMPLLPLMTVEVGLYGFIAGVAREKGRLNTFVSVALALVGGRIAFIVMAFLLGRIDGSLAAFVGATMAPGIIAAMLQLILIPIIAAPIARGLARESK
ncbi:MAG: ECF transporter S component [Spirochaetota bacterium]